MNKLDKFDTICNNSLDSLKKNHRYHDGGQSTFPLHAHLAHYFYKDLYAIPAMHFSIDRDHWTVVAPCLTDDLSFHTWPSNPAIPIQGKLISVRHQSVESLDDLSNFVYLTAIFGCAFVT